jgi:hypothetical protein
MVQSRGRCHAGASFARRMPDVLSGWPVLSADGDKETGTVLASPIPAALAKAQSLR